MDILIKSNNNDIGLESEKDVASTVSFKLPNHCDTMLMIGQQTVFRQGQTLLDQGCPNFGEKFFGASVHEKIEI